MVFKIAIAGKGGTGKTTFAGLMVSYLNNVLVVDADPNQNLNEVLGVEVDSTVGNVREKVLERPPDGFDKVSYMKLMLSKALVEEDNFDLLVMGRPEGRGCYCYSNHLIGEYMKLIENSYDYLVIDNDAGLEHLSRGRTSNIDVLFILSNPTFRDVDTAVRIKEMVSSLKLNIKEVFLVLNRINEDKLPDKLKSHITDNGLNLIGCIPDSDEVKNFDIEGTPLVNLPQESKVRNIVKHIVEEKVLKN